MYRLEYLPMAKQDMADIVRYISHDLSNPVAAGRLADEMVEAAEGLTDFPYSRPVYHPIRALQQEYRRLLVKNYFLFYFVDEEEKRITIARVLYARRDYEHLLD